jgi:Ca2+-binding EF-hand superfamily protein
MGTHFCVLKKCLGKIALSWEYVRTRRNIMERNNGRKIIVPAIFILLIPGALLFGQADQSGSFSDRGAQAYWGTLEASKLLARIDANSDGYISKQEWESFFTDRDANKDQRLSREEIQGSLRSAGYGSEDAEGAKDSGRLAAFDRLDANKNGKIDPNEWPGKAKDYRYLDSNHDGFISREEFLSPNGRWSNETFENLDFNGDKVISRSEWLDSDSSFDRLDRDHNGAIDKREFYNPR